MALSNIAGFPRIGPNRELKFATEGYWRGDVSDDELLATAKRIRVDNWKFMQQAGVDLIPSNDFSLYDHVLDTIALVGAVPDRYEHSGGPVDLDTYFAMARGRQEGGVDVTAMEMTKWFDTNYHYIVPELGPDTKFSLSSTKPFDEHAEAMEELGIDTVPVILGPVSFLLLGKSADGVPAEFDRLDLIEALLPVYGEVIERLAEQGATWVQLDEPCFVEDRSEHELDALAPRVRGAGEGPRAHPRSASRPTSTTSATPIGVLRDLPVEGIGLDFHRGGPDLDRQMVRKGDRGTSSSSPPRADSRTSGCSPGSSTAATSGSTSSSTASTCSAASATAASELVVSTSCSLLHTPARPGQRAALGRARRRAALLDGVRQAEGRRGRDARHGHGRGPRGDRG